MNQRDNQMAELLAGYVDQHLRTGNKVSSASSPIDVLRSECLMLLRACAPSCCQGLSVEETERVLDDTIVLFRFVNAKDVFEAHYKKLLAKVCRGLLGV